VSFMLAKVQFFSRCYEDFLSNFKTYITGLPEKNLEDNEIRDIIDHTNKLIVDKKYAVLVSINDT